MPEEIVMMGFLDWVLILFLVVLFLLGKLAYEYVKKRWGKYL